MASYNQIFLLVSLLATVGFHHLASAQQCYSCSTGTSTGSTTCSYTISNAPVTSCQAGCQTQVTQSPSTSSIVTRGCASSGVTGGCSYDSTTSSTTCTSICTSDNCNGAVQQTLLGCYSCNSQYDSNCMTVNSATGTQDCNYGTCLTTTTMNAQGTTTIIARGCGIYPVATTYNYTTTSTGNTVYNAQCSGSFCNSGTTVSTSGVQCYSCSGELSYSLNVCLLNVSTSTVGMITCPSGSCATVTTFSTAGTNNQLQTITRGCGQKNCASSNCVTSATTTSCFSTCTSSGCNGYVNATAQLQTATCSAPGIGADITTLWSLFTLIFMTLLY